jgi:hypothetical protein
MRPTITPNRPQRHGRDTRELGRNSTVAHSSASDFRTHPNYHEQRGFSSIGHGARKREVLPPC